MPKTVKMKDKKDKKDKKEVVIEEDTEEDNNQVSDVIIARDSDISLKTAKEENNKVELNATNVVEKDILLESAHLKIEF